MPPIEQQRTAIAGPFRYHSRGDRFYGTIYEIDGIHEVEWAMSTTTWLGKIIPPSPYLLEWIIKHGQKEADRLRDEKAAYGTLIHAVIEQVSLGAMWNSGMKTAEEVMEEFRPFDRERERNFFRKNENKWINDLNHGVRSWIHFCNEKNVEIIHAELFMTGEIEGNVATLTTGGTCDAAVEMDFNGKRVNALVDVKSGGIWPNHKPQLQCYRALIEQIDEEFEDCMLFNWSPKDWRKKPTYTLKNQTPDADEELAFKAYVDLAALTLEHRPRPERVFEGDSVGMGDEQGDGIGYIDVSADVLFIEEHLGNPNVGSSVEEEIPFPVPIYK